MTLSCRSAGAPATPACGMMKTTGTSSSIGCFFATTAASRTPGTTAITCSISDAATFSPPTLSMSLARSPNLMKPCSSSATRSPVMKIAVLVKAFARRLLVVQIFGEQRQAGNALDQEIAGVADARSRVPSSSVMRISIFRRGAADRHRHVGLVDLADDAVGDGLGHAPPADDLDAERSEGRRVV